MTTRTAPTTTTAAAPIADPIIEVDGVVVDFDDLRALDGVDLRIDPGEVRGLLGPNGSGKTTLVNVIATLRTATSGTVRISGHDVRNDPTAVRRRLGLAGQYAAVDDLLTGRENLEIVGRLYGLDRRTARRRADEVLERLSLTGAANRLVRTYSGGMRRRLDLGASLTGRPEVLLLDEPTTGLDPRTRNELWDFLRDLVAGGTTVLLTTQYLEEADALADRITVIDSGRVIAEGTANELKRSVGASSLVVTPEDRDDGTRVAALLATASSVPARIDEASGAVSAPVTDPVSAVVMTATILRDARIAVSDIAVRRPSLDDVFLTITGDEATATPDSAGPAHADAEREEVA